jgi:AcrR family transcriptional regulator
VRADDPSILAAARQAVERHGWRETTLERIAGEAGLSRMTLHRRGVTRAAVLAGLGSLLEDEYRAALWPALTAPGSARERLELACAGMCDVAERNLELLAALGDAPRDRIFHEPGGSPGGDSLPSPAAPNPRGGGVLTRRVFTEPVERLLRDGAADGSLRAVEDPAETATVLFNLVGWTYRHLRRGHGWEPDRARRGVLTIALEGLAGR